MPFIAVFLSSGKRALIVPEKTGPRTTLSGAAGADGAAAGEETTPSNVTAAAKRGRGSFIS